MSVLKEIKKAIVSDEAIVKINGISYLHRWTKTGLNKEVDEMSVTFSPIDGITKGGKTFLIKSRNLDGIISEIETYTAEYLKEVAERAAKNLKSGYR